MLFRSQGQKVAEALATADELDRRLGAQLGLTGTWQDLRRRIEGLVAGASSMQRTESFAAHSLLVEELLAFQLQAADSSALTLDPDYAAAHQNLAVVCQSTNDLRGAEAHYRAAVRLEPGNAAAHYNLGVVVSAQGRIDDGIEQIGRAHV